MKFSEFELDNEFCISEGYAVLFDFVMHNNEEIVALIYPYNDTPNKPVSVVINRNKNGQVVCQAFNFIFFSTNQREEFIYKCQTLKLKFFNPVLSFDF